MTEIRVPAVASPTPGVAGRDDGVLVRRLLALTAILAVPMTIGVATGSPRLHPAIQALFGYTPDRLLHGAVWTLPLSGMIAAHPHATGPYTILPIVVLAPAVLAFGAWRPLRAFFAGHIVSTLGAAAVIVATAAAGWHEGHVLLHTVDAGVSAGVAAVGGMLAVTLARSRWRVLAPLIVASLLLVFTRRIATEDAGRLLADCEHLVALTTGVLVEWRWSARSPSTTAPVRS